MTTETPKKKSTKTRTKKSEVKEVVEKQSNPMEDMMKSMTPEMMEQFMNFIKSQQTTVEEKEEPKKQKITRAYLSKIRDKEVCVRSVSHSVVGFVSKKTNMVYRWINHGDVETLTVGEILEMESSSKLFLHAPLLVVDDEEVNEGLDLTSIKEAVEVFDDFEEFIQLPIKEIKDSISKVESDFIPTLCGKVQQAIDNNVLTDFRKIRELEKMMKVELKY